MKRDKQLLRLHGVDNKRNSYGVKDQSNTYRIRKGIFYKGFDVPTKDEVDKEIKVLKSEGLKYFVVYFKEEGFFRIFREDKIKEMK